MSLEENKKVSHEFFDRFSAGDLEGALALMTDDATATDNAMGNVAANIGPMYGTKRRTTASAPHSNGFGMPISQRPIPTGIP